MKKKTRGEAKRQRTFELGGAQKEASVERGEGERKGRDERVLRSGLPPRTWHQSGYRPGRFASERSRAWLLFDGRGGVEKENGGGVQPSSLRLAFVRAVSATRLSGVSQVAGRVRRGALGSSSFLSVAEGATEEKGCV